MAKPIACSKTLTETDSNVSHSFFTEAALMELASNSDWNPLFKDRRSQLLGFIKFQRTGFLMYEITKA